jgi:hypothetical protein
MKFSKKDFDKFLEEWNNANTPIKQKRMMNKIVKKGLKINSDINDELRLLDCLHTMKSQWINKYEFFLVHSTDKTYTLRNEFVKRYLGHVLNTEYPERVVIMNTVDAIRETQLRIR